VGRWMNWQTLAAYRTIPPTCAGGCRMTATYCSATCCPWARHGLRARWSWRGCATAAGSARTARRPGRRLNSADGLSDPAFRAAPACAEFNQVPYLAPLRATVRRVLGAAFSYPVKVLRGVYPERHGPHARGSHTHSTRSPHNDH
jgi:hypothetical protein